MTERRVGKIVETIYGLFSVHSFEIYGFLGFVEPGEI